MRSASPLASVSPSSPPALSAAQGEPRHLIVRESHLIPTAPRWQAMEECEETGGFLADSLGLQELLELLQLATRWGLLIIVILTILNPLAAEDTTPPHGGLERPTLRRSRANFRGKEKISCCQTPRSFGPMELLDRLQKLQKTRPGISASLSTTFKGWDSSYFEL